MKICMPTMGDNGLEERVHDHFGSASHFTIYDTDTEEIEIVANSNQHHSHGTCHPIRALGLNRVDVVLTNGMGKRAIMMLNESDIKVYTLEGDTVSEAIERYKTGALTELTLETGCQGHGCH